MMSGSDPLLPPSARATLPPLYATEQERDPTVHAKLFTSWTGWTWFLTEFDGEDRCFGLVSGFDVELGYFSLREIEELRGPGGIRVERDLHFQPKPLSAVRKELDALRDGPPEEPASSTAVATLSSEWVGNAEATTLGPDKITDTLTRLAETARFILSGTAGDMLEEAAEELALQVTDLAETLRRRDPTAHPKDQPQHPLALACRGLLQDIDEVLERQGEAWWDETVTSGTHHRTEAERLLGGRSHDAQPEGPEPA